MKTQIGDCDSSIIKFLAGENDDRGVGTGILYKNNRVITCTHVLKDTLDKPEDIETGKLFNIQFPILDSSPRKKAKLIHYYPVDNKANSNDLEDIAILEIIDNVPESPKHFNLKVMEYANGVEVRTMGFASTNGSKQLVHVPNATIVGKNEQQYYQIEEDPKHSKIEAGYSGSPLIDKDDNVLGMLVYKIKNKTRNIPYAIPSRQLKQAIESFEDHQITKTTNILLQFTKISPDAIKFINSILSRLARSTNFYELELTNNQNIKLMKFGSIEDSLSFLSNFRHEFLYLDWRAQSILHAPKVRIYLLDPNEFTTWENSDLFKSTAELPMSPRLEILSDFEPNLNYFKDFVLVQQHKYPIKKGFEKHIKYKYYCLRDKDDHKAISEGKILPLWDEQRYQREEALYRFAYLWITLDQLPIGSWGRSIPQWMVNVWKDLPKFSPSPIMEDEGGFETTILNLSTLAQLQGEEELVETYYDSAIQYLKARVVAGGYGTLNSSRHGYYIDPQPRHTALAVWLLGITLNKFTANDTNLTILYKEGVESLFADTNQLFIDSFIKDRNPFLLYLVTSQIVLFIKGKLDLSPIHIDDKIKKRVVDFWDIVEEQLLNNALKDNYKPKPNLTKHNDAVTIYNMIVPYGDFLRMESYSLLTATMFLHKNATPKIFTKVRRGINYLLDNYLKNYGAPSKRYLRDPLQVKVRGLNPYYSCPEHNTHPDLGCNALMLQILRNEEICNILWPTGMDKKYQKARYLLTEDLVDHFDRALISPKLYELTNAGMMATILAGDSNSIKEKLTNEVFQDCYQIRNSTLTNDNFDNILSEESIHKLVNRLISKDADGNKIQLSAYSISRFLLANIKPGRYTKIDNSDRQLQENLSKKTLEVYNTDEFSEKFYLTWKDEVDVTIISPFIELLKKKFPTERIKILDVGCGVGIYTQYFIQKHFHVDILDGAESNIAFTRDLIKKSCDIEYQSFVIDITNNDERNSICSTDKYHGVWCSGLFAHLLSDQQIDILNWFNKILIKDGVILVNAMIDNPRLFATDGRFYSYLGSPVEFSTMLKNTNFTIQQTLTKTISKNTHQEPYLETIWANFFATKTTPDTESFDAELAIKLTSIAYQKSSDEFIEVHANENKNTAREKFIEFTLNELQKRVQNSLEINNSLRVLDAGCGPGDFTHAMANRHWNVTGVDLSDNMIRYARKYRNDGNIEYLNYEIGDLRHLPDIWRNLFDAVITITVFHHIPVFESALMNTLVNIARVLKKGGIFRFDAQLNRSSGFDPDLRYIQGYKNIDEILNKINFESAGFKTVDKNKDVVIDKLPMYRNGYKREIALEFATIWLTKA